jgi:hypothetical protein
LETTQKNDDGDGDVTMESEKHYFLTCSCAAFKHTANYCTETIAVAASLGLIDLDMLIDEIATRNGVGRKQTKIKGLELAKKAGAVPKTHKPEYFYDALKKQIISQVVRRGRGRGWLRLLWRRQQVPQAPERPGEG